MKIARRIMLELWATLVLAGIVAFLGPFGTYLMDDYLPRFWYWLALMLGAYITMRPIMLVLGRIARMTKLPASALVFWGLLLASFPLALLWQVSSPEHVRLLGGYFGLLSFTLLCATSVVLVAWWANKADIFLREQTQTPTPTHDPETRIDEYSQEAKVELPRLLARLSTDVGPGIVALQSEDHYVRVHSHRGEELILMRLSDAIAEMEGCPGIQPHRSWWVSTSAVADTCFTGDRPSLTMTNDLMVPIARKSIEKVRQSLAQKLSEKSDHQGSSAQPPKATALG